MKAVMVPQSTGIFLSVIPNVTNTAERPSNSSLQGLFRNVSIPDGCVEFVLEQRDFVPWNNPDNVVSPLVEKLARQVTDFSLLPVLFLIGLPSSVINMAVFGQQGLKERVNLCLFALSLADGLYLLVAIFTYSDRVSRYFIATSSLFSPVTIFMMNNHLLGFFGLTRTSQVLSAIIASERCLCVTRPLQFQAMLKTKTTAVILTLVYFLVTGPYFLVASKLHFACFYNPLSDTSFRTVVPSEFYKSNSMLINYLDTFVYGAGTAMFSMSLVAVTTIITTVKLRQIVTWRSETTSSLSVREVALTKMLIGTSVLFLFCVSPTALFRFVWLFLPEMNIGRRHHNLYHLFLWVMECLSYTNSSLNIFVYYTMGSRYRQTFRALFNRPRK